MHLHSVLGTFDLTPAPAANIHIDTTAGLTTWSLRSLACGGRVAVPLPTQHQLHESTTLEEIQGSIPPFRFLLFTFCGTRLQVLCRSPLSTCGRAPPLCYTFFSFCSSVVCTYLSTHIILPAIWPAPSQRRLSCKPASRIIRITCASLSTSSLFVHLRFASTYQAIPQTKRNQRRCCTSILPTLLPTQSDSRPCKRLVPSTAAASR